MGEGSYGTKFSAFDFGKAWKRGIWGGGVWWGVISREGMKLGGITKTTRTCTRGSFVSAIGFREPKVRMEGHGHGQGGGVEAPVMLRF